MTPEFFDRHVDKLGWYWVSKNSSMTEEFFERHIDEVVWDTLSGNKSMTPEFFEKHIDKVNFYVLSTNTSLPPEFFERYTDRVNWGILSGNTFIEYKMRLLRRCLQIRKLQRTCKIPNRYKLTKLIKTRAFCEWYYQGDNIGGIISKRRIENTLSTKLVLETHQEQSNHNIVIPLDE